MNQMTVDDILRLYPPTTRARGLARRKADDEVFEKYPEMHVAFIDEWNGDELTRIVVAAHPTFEEFTDAFEALPSEVRERARLMSTHTHDLFGPRFELAAGEPEPGVK
jgi:hypothetical protein